METRQFLRPSQGERRSWNAYAHSSGYKSQRTERGEFSQVNFLLLFKLVAVQFNLLSHTPWQGTQNL